MDADHIFDTLVKLVVAYMAFEVAIVLVVIALFVFLIRKAL